MPKPTILQIRRGLIVWVDDCPPLDDDRDKRRPVIVVEPSVGTDGSDAVVVAVSATAGPREFDAIALPNRTTQPQCSTGLPKPCNAIPRWSLLIARDRVSTCTFAGSLGGRPLAMLLSAYLLRRDGWRADADGVRILVVASADGSDAPASRSEARLITRHAVRRPFATLDFAGISSIGQGFADEIFRVFANEHPSVKLIAINANEQVTGMIRRAEDAKKFGERGPA